MRDISNKPQIIKTFELNTEKRTYQENFKLVFPRFSSSFYDE